MVLEQAQSRFWSGWFRVGTKPVLEQAQSRFWSGWFRVGTKPVLEQAQSRFGSSWFRVGTKPVLEQAQSRFWCGRFPNRFCIKTGFASSIEATKLDLSQNRSIVTAGLGTAQGQFWSRHKAGFGAAGYKTGFVSIQVLHLFYIFFYIYIYRLCA